MRLLTPAVDAVGSSSLDCKQVAVSTAASNYNGKTVLRASLVKNGESRYKFAKIVQQPASTLKCLPWPRRRLACGLGAERPRAKTPWLDADETEHRCAPAPRPQATRTRRRQVAGGTAKASPPATELESSVIMRRSGSPRKTRLRSAPLLQRPRAVEDADGRLCDCTSTRAPSQRQTTPRHRKESSLSLMEVAQNVDVRRQAQTRLPALVELLVLAETKVKSYERVDASRRRRRRPRQTAVAIAHATRRRAADDGLSTAENHDARAWRLKAQSVAIRRRARDHSSPQFESSTLLRRCLLACRCRRFLKMRRLTRPSLRMIAKRPACATL